MPTTLQDRSEAGEGSPLRYAYKASLIGSAHQFELTEEGLSWRIAGRSGVWDYADISAVKLSYRPVSMQQQRFRADIDNARGGRIAILSTTWQTATLMAPQGHLYRDFIVELHRRMQAAGSTARLVGGLGPKTYTAALALLACLVAAMIGLLLTALLTSNWMGALFLVGFAALFTWQVGGFVTRNRPRRYSFDQLPDALLPKAVRNQAR
ncbi:hypothetical protein [Bradyrhizobium elkanii]|uniref:hypothetical protein n=1 Tax=Bradyrhizobium elkanii TaxID=29448 RepID=UPI0003A96908|nr:hypothetical protein [Bradyrhizobium elkanii]MCP1732518.1 hypothetical protein [Bradyrhizobium elkanii]MCS3567856.1 hypothetical protein [Bradyrhizobium elkanii]MCS3590661.1 hypothetical protein [Bradyrhizobium elkanii]MCS3620104.1 hypothetical protein [Bradyrhizobium elkanii]MCW2111641.1 hypothetical protein [Bradyrhizobium elkanii]